MNKEGQSSQSEGELTSYYCDYIGLDKQIFERKIVIFSYLSVLTYVLGAQKNRIIERVVLSIHKICFGWEIRKLFFWYSLLNKGLGHII